MWSVSAKRCNGVSGSLKVWLAAIVAVATVGAATLLDMAQGPAKPSRTHFLSRSGTTAGQRIRTHGTPKLGVTLSKSASTFTADPNVGNSQGNQTVYYLVTVKNEGNVTLVGVHFIVYTDPPLLGNSTATNLSSDLTLNYSNNLSGILPIGCVPGLSAPGTLKCYVGNSTIAQMPPGTTRHIKLYPDFAQDAQQLARKSISMYVTATGTGTDGQMTSITTAPVSMNISGVNYNDALRIHLSFRPDKVTTTQVFTMFVSLTNESSTPLTNVVVNPQNPDEYLPGPPLGNKLMEELAGFPRYRCEAAAGNITCEANPSPTLVPGATETMDFGEIVPTQVSSEYYRYHPTSSLYAYAVGTTPSGQHVYAAATGDVVNVS